jgi:hypothetical protein
MVKNTTSNISSWIVPWLWRLTAKARVQCQVSPRGTYGERSALEDVFLQILPVFPVTTASVSKLFILPITDTVRP